MYAERMDGFESGEICRECGGSCCKSNGCSLAPDDMLRELADREVTREAVLKWLRQGDYAIDSFSHQGERVYYIRMRHKFFTFIGVDAMGECAALTDKGCSRSFAERPTGGRCLEGRADYKCEQHYTEEKMYRDWKPYTKLLQSIWEEWEPVLEADGTFDLCEEAYMEYQMEQRRKRMEAEQKTGTERK